MLDRDMPKFWLAGVLLSSSCVARPIGDDRPERSVEDDGIVGVWADVQRLAVHERGTGWHDVFVPEIGATNLLEPLALFHLLMAGRLVDGGYDAVRITVGDIWVERTAVTEPVERTGHESTLVVRSRFCMRDGRVVGLARQWPVDRLLLRDDDGWRLDGELDLGGPPICAETLR